MTTESKKYEITEKMKMEDGYSVYQIKALKSIPRYGVKKGDLGGYVSGYHNLSQSGNCWIADEAVAMNESLVENNAYLSGESRITMTVVVTDDTRVEETATVVGKSMISKRAVIKGEAHVNDSTISGYCVIAENSLINNSCLRGHGMTHGQASIMDSDLLGSIQVGNLAYVYDSKIRGSQIQIGGKASIEFAVIGKTASNRIEIIDNAFIQSANVWGENITIQGDVQLKEGVVVRGNSISLRDFCQLEGCIYIGDGVSISELVHIINLDKNYWKLKDQFFKGDLKITAAIS